MKNYNLILIARKILDLKNIFDKAYSQADQLIALGRDMKHVLEQKVARFEKRPKVTIIENWADLDMVSPMSLMSHSEGIVIGYAGNIGRVQGLQSVIKDVRIADNTNIEFHIWGTGAEENNLEELTKSQRMTNVIFHGAYLRSKQSEVLCNNLKSLNVYFVRNPFLISRPF